ncbi:MAG TPA: hypothetical protein DCY98_07255 [Nitrospinae bacterium]|nr:hypothetical protein [Nitrospinota bacterium]
MFIGHYGVALAAKKVDKNISLGLLFFATQFVDILFFVLILMGIERMSIVPGITAANPLDFTYYPYSHSLTASLLWAGLFFVVFKITSSISGSRNNRIALVVAAIVLSHFFLDVIVHRPDLPLFGDDSYKLGLGLWNYVISSSLIEILILVAGLWLYLKSTKSITFGGKYGMIIFAVFLIMMQMASLFMPPPPDIRGFATFGLVYQLMVVGVVSWLDRKRG